MKKISGIYCIENTLDGKKYIGQSKNIYKRMNTKHIACHALIRAVEKYGKEVFKKYILLYCEEFELDRLEKECIKLFNSHVSENGYNISFGGKPVMENRKHSEESRKKISSFQKGKVLSEETKAKMSASKMGHAGLCGKDNPNFGKTMSEKQRKTLSEKNKGRPSNMLGKHHTEEAKKKLSDANIGKKMSEETKLKISMAQKGKPKTRRDKRGIEND